MSELVTWQSKMHEAMKLFVDQTVGLQDEVHTDETPLRFVRAMEEYTSGYREDAAAALQKSFEDSCGQDEMVHIYNIPIASMCAHHCAPIIGRAHFAYIPKNRVLGLSKIPRFIDVLSRRLQIQEKLCTEITGCFMQATGVTDCAVEIIAYHCCMMMRGVRTHASTTVTSSLKGAFRINQMTRNEFFSRRQELTL